MSSSYKALESASHTKNTKHLHEYEKNEVMNEDQQIKVQSASSSAFTCQNEISNHVFQVFIEEKLLFIKNCSKSQRSVLFKTLNVNELCSKAHSAPLHDSMEPFYVFMQYFVSSSDAAAMQLGYNSDFLSLLNSRAASSSFGELSALASLLTLLSSVLPADFTANIVYSKSFGAILQICEAESKDSELAGTRFLYRMLQNLSNSGEIVLVLDCIRDLGLVGHYSSLLDIVGDDTADFVQSLLFKIDRLSKFYL